MDTIFAQASKFGKAGVAVFRISGSCSIDVLRQLLNDNSELNIEPRVMHYKKIYDPKNLGLIDHAMVVYFQSPNSFTGEDVVEIHTHGSIAITKMLTNVLLDIEGLRLAEPGEFARRAFLNNKFDLTAAEGLADLIEAETIMQHKQAIRQLGGELERLYNAWRERLLQVISLLEAYIDFPDEEIPTEVLTTILAGVEELKSTISVHLNDNRKGELLRNGLKLTIIGKPNTGKSSLLNFLMQREVAIVSNIAGTTRDIIEGHLDIGGYPIIVQDTAGIRSGSSDIIELEGINRAINSAKQADIIIMMVDATIIQQFASDPSPETKDRILKILEVNFLQNSDIGYNDKTIFVLNKIDLYNSIDEILIEGKKPLKISIKEKTGLDLLMKEIELLASKIAGIEDVPQITRERHRHQLKQALQYLSHFSLKDDIILAAEDIRMAIRALSNITGKITVEEILGEIFSNFCIGK